MMREYASLEILRSGRVLDLGGIRVKAIEGEIRPGDLYVAERNSGPKLLTLKKWSLDGSFAIPTTSDYCFNQYECVLIGEEEE